MRTFTITVGYNVCHVLEVEVHAGAVAAACEQAITIANATAEGWRATDGASSSYVEAIEASGASIQVPEKFTEVGVLVPDVETLRKGLELVVKLGKANLAEIDAQQTVRAMVVAARGALKKAQH